jgi:hypothetical protein
LLPFNFANFAGHEKCEFKAHGNHLSDGQITKILIMIGRQGISLTTWPGAFIKPGWKPPISFPI